MELLIIFLTFVTDFISHETGENPHTVTYFVPFTAIVCFYWNFGAFELQVLLCYSLKQALAVVPPHF